MTKPGFFSSRDISYWALGIACLALALTILVFVSEFHSISQTGMTPIRAIVQLLLVGIFPLSAIAFVRLEVPMLIEHLKRDCQLFEMQDLSPLTTSARWCHSSYAIHYSLAMLATFVGVEFFFVNPKSDTGLPDINTLQAMRFGFLGAYVYCIGLIYRRYTTLDLQPHVYFYCALGLIAGVVFNYVAFEAISNMSAIAANPTPNAPPKVKFDGIEGVASAILAFSLGYFPNLAIRWFGRMSRKSLGESQRRSDELPLSLIDGISVMHEARLQDEGIDNIQNLATSSIRDLLTNTPFSAHEIVEWIDQAVLYLYLDPSQIESFRRAGVRSVSDFDELWGGLCVTYTKESGLVTKHPKLSATATDFDENRKALAQQLQSTAERLDGLYIAIVQGPNMGLVRTYWQNVEILATRARASLVRKVCCNLGKELREYERKVTTATTPNDVLRQVVGSLLEVLACPGDKLPEEETKESMYGQAWLNLLAGRPSEARTLYEQCIARFPDCPAALNDLAWLYLANPSQQTPYARAFELAERAVKLIRYTPAPRTELPGFLDTLALAHIRLQRPEEGVQLIMDAIVEWSYWNNAPQPKFLETLLEAAEVYHAQGNKQAATKTLDELDKQGYATPSTAARAVNLRRKL